MGFRNTLTLFVAVLSLSAQAQVMTQALPTTVQGQPQMTGGSYTLDAAFDPTGQSVASSASTVFKMGFVGQITDPRGLEIGSTDVSEGASAPLTATAILDDDTVAPLPADAVTWSLVAGPISSVSLAGVVRSLPVFQDTEASIQGTWFGISEIDVFRVLNDGTDNVAPVAGDGIDDAWQFLYFDSDANGVLTLDEAEGAEPMADPDGDEQNNYYEFLAGYVPTDGNSYLEFGIASIIGDSVTIGLSKFIPTTEYTLLGSSDLSTSDPWSVIGAPISGLSQSNVLIEHISVDHHFYRLRLAPAP